MTLTKWMTALVLSLAMTHASADDWSRFRGPNGLGTTEATSLPTEFGPDKNVIWKTPLPPGYSSPILGRDRIFLTAYEGKTLLTLALDRATGKILWRAESPRDREDKLDSRNSPASPSAVTDGTNIFVFFHDYGWSPTTTKARNGGAIL